jgi:mTERF
MPPKLCWQVASTNRSTQLVLSLLYLLSLSLYSNMPINLVFGSYIPSIGTVNTCTHQRHKPLTTVAFLMHEKSISPIENGVKDRRSHNSKARKNVNGTNNTHVLSIMELLRDRYDSTSARQQSHCTNDTNDDDNHGQDDWTKMRRFLYRVTSTANSKQTGDHGLTIYKVRKVLEFLEEVFPDRDIQRSILLQVPRILTKNVNTRLRPTVEFLQSLYEGSLFVTAISRNPNLLLTSGTGYEGDDDLNLVETFLRTDLGLTQNAINQLKQSDPQLFQLSMVQLLSVVSFLRNVFEMQHYDYDESSICFPDATATTTTKTIAKLIMTHPMIFQLSVSENLVPRIRYLQERCLLLDKDLATLLKSSRGAVLGLSVKENLEPTIDLLLSMVSNTELRKVILSHAQILGLSLDNLRNKISYFDSIDTMGQNHPEPHKKPSLASRILLKAPAVYSLSLTGNIIPTVKFLAKIWGQPYCENKRNVSGEWHAQQQDDTSSNLSSLLNECPSILTVSLVGNIIPTVSFYVRTGYLSLDSDGILQANTDAKITIIRGRYITASLFHRLLPRWHYHAKKQAYQEKASVMAPPLYVLAGTTDAEFCARLGYDITDYLAFKNEATPHLKFTSQFETWIETGRPIDI